MGTAGTGYVTGALLVLQGPSTSKGHPIPNGRGTSPGQGGFGQVDTRHMGTGTVSRVTFARVVLLCSCCSGNLKGSASGFGVCVPTAEKMEQKQVF